MDIRIQHEISDVKLSISSGETNSNISLNSDLSTIILRISMF